MQAGAQNDFSGSLEQLQAAVADGCDGRMEWPDQLAEGIRSALSFAATNPAAARVLTASGSEDSRSDPQLTRYFSEKLGTCLPGDRRPPAPIDEGVVASLTSVVSDHLRWDRADRLEEIAPNLIYLALLPYVGFTDAKRLAGTDLLP